MDEKSDEVVRQISLEERNEHLTVQILHRDEALAHTRKQLDFWQGCCWIMTIIIVVLLIFVLK